jgi:hypothetical protein
LLRLLRPLLVCRTSLRQLQAKALLHFMQLLLNVLPYLLQLHVLGS